MLSRTQLQRQTVVWKFYPVAKCSTESDLLIPVYYLMKTPAMRLRKLKFVTYTFSTFRSGTVMDDLTLRYFGAGFWLDKNIFLYQYKIPNFNP